MKIHIAFSLAAIIFTRLLPMLLMAQPTTVNLNSAISGNHLYEASQEINLLPGFEYNNSLGGDFTTRIVSSNGQSYAFTETTESTTLPVVTTYPVGTIVGSQGVSSTGAATYSIPISVSPGVLGMTPGLSVNYNSQGGEGLMGYGWELTGLSSITRVPSDLYHETEISTIQFNANDHFALDGQRLLSVATSEYRTEIETFSRIIAYGTNGNPTYFTVETKDGKILEYGNTTDSRIEAQGRTEGLIWNLNKITDKNGNYITITYYENNTTGEYYPLSINYTGTTRKSPFNSITFDYQVRALPLVSYISGSKITLGHLISNINVVNEGTTVHRYNFQYHATASRLTEIIEYGKNNSRLNSSLITMGNADISLAEKVFASSDRYKYFQDDYNGDGKEDLFAVYTINRQWVLYLANDVLGFSQAATGTLPANYKINFIYTGDYNGDGLGDIMLFRLEDSKYIPSFLISTGGSFVVTNYSSSNANFATDFTFFTGDFNGNGITDLLVKKAGGYNCINYEFNIPQVTYSVFGQSTITWGDNSLSEIKEVPLDINGNGKTDLMTVDVNGCRFYENGNGKMRLLFSSAYPTTSNVYLFGDFNSDGNTDLFSFDSYNNWKICLSKGTGFNLIDNTTLSGFIPDISYNNYYTHDANGDGKSDVIVIGRGTSINNPVKIFVAYSNINGQGLDLQTYEPPSSLVVNRYCNYFSDYNGDGNTDFLYINGSTGIIYTICRGRNQYLISTIKDGFGQNIGFSYKPISDVSVYTKGSLCSYPLIDYQGPLYVVSSTWSDNINNTQSTTNYTYNSARVHQTGKGFLGFATITSNNPTMNRKTINQYEYNPTYYNVALKQSNTYTSDDICITQSVLTNSFIDYGNKRILPYVSQVIDNDYLSNSCKTTINNINNDGNPTTISEMYDDGSYNTTSYTNYVSSGSWMPCKPLTVTKTRKHYADAATFSLATTYTYNSSTGQISTETTGPLTTTYQYDTNGNISYLTQSSGGTSRTIHYEYDDQGRFATDIYNHLNHHTQRVYDNATGNVLSETSPNSQITSYTYDNFGRVVTVTHPTGQVVNVSYQWATGTRPQNAMYYKLTTSTGLPSVKEYYDAFGRVIKTEKTGYNGTLIRTNTIYNTKGQVINQTLPYYSGQQAYAREYSYDDFGRIAIDAGPTAITTYTYSGKKIQTVAGGLSTSKTVDSQGNLVSVTDDGGTISYTYKSIGKPGIITTNGSSWAIVYDSYGRRTQLTDPNVGTITYGYNGFGELTAQADANGNSHTMTYDALGRMLTRVGSEGTTAYTYDPTGNPGLLSSVTYPGGSESYGYDSYGRMISKSKVIIDESSTTYTTSYTYNALGKLTSKTYPSSFAINYGYNSTTGYLTTIRRSDNNALIWQCNGMNALDDYTQYTYGNGLITTKTYDSFSNLKGKQTSNSVQNLSYIFDPMTGNLLSRSDVNRGLTESFNYDNLARLSGITGPSTLTTNYNSNGNILFKTDVGDYSYGTLPHAVTGVTNPQGNITTEQEITYNNHNKTQSITEDNLNIQFTYDHNFNRTSSKLFQNGSIQKTVYYLGNYEKEVSGNNIRQLNYIGVGDGVAAIYEIVNGTGTMYYVHTDHLGSFDAITNSSGSVVETYSFDAWGRRRNASNWTYSGLPASYLFSRGYTGHEHIDVFQLINMNGRMYDPLLGRMLAADNFVQFPDYTQSFNRYAYCLNNPLKYIDPSGEKTWFGKLFEWIGKHKEDILFSSIDPTYLLGRLNTEKHYSVKQAIYRSFNNVALFNIPYLLYNKLSDNPNYNIRLDNFLHGRPNINGTGSTTPILTNCAGYCSNTYSNYVGSNLVVRRTTERVFGYVPGLGTVYGESELPPNCTLWDGFYWTQQGERAWGVAYQNDIYISPAAQQAGPAQLFTTIAHELVHVCNYYDCLDITSPNGRVQTEYAAHSYSALYAGSMGWHDLQQEHHNLTVYRYNPVEIDPRYNNFSLPFHPYP